MTNDKIRPYRPTGIKAQSDTAAYAREYWRRFRRDKPQQRRHPAK